MMDDSPALVALIKTGDKKAFYASSCWRKRRKKALERDRYTCQRCKDKGRYTRANTVHHVKEIKNYPHLALTLSNLLSVCHTCHDEIHERDASNLRKTTPEPVTPERW